MHQNCLGCLEVTLFLSPQGYDLHQGWVGSLLGSKVKCENCVKQAAYQQQQL